MKKHFLIVVGLTVILILVCSCELFHVCSFDQKNIADSYFACKATCSDSACYYYSCKCGKMDSKTFSVGEPLGHNYENLSCTVCGQTNPEVSELRTAISAESISLDATSFRTFLYYLELFDQQFIMTPREDVSMKDLKFKMFATLEGNKLSNSIECNIQDDVIESLDNIVSHCYFLITIPESQTQLTFDIV